MEKKIIELGTEIYLTDPCYDLTTWCQSLLGNVKSGKYIVNYIYNESKEETILSVVHEDYDLDIFKHYNGRVKIIGSLGVDSGTIGIFDREYYEKYHFENDINEDWYKKHIIDSDFERASKTTDNAGVWCNTSYGDGVYYAKVYFEEDNKIIRVDIIC